jgi:hypothetical protein
LLFRYSSGLWRTISRSTDCWIIKVRSITIFWWFSTVIWTNTWRISNSYITIGMCYNWKRNI